MNLPISWEKGLGLEVHEEDEEVVSKNVLVLDIKVGVRVVINICVIIRVFI